MSRASLLLACLLLTATACAPKVFVREPPIPGKAFVYVYRPGGFVGWALALPGVLTTANPPMARTFPIRPDKYVVTPVDPGVVTLATSGPDSKPVSVAISVVENTIAFIKCEMKMGWMIGGYQCQVVPQEIGEHDVARVKRNERGD